MSISRNQQHYIALTVIYDELTDFTIGEGKTFRDARELMSELCECEYEEVPTYIKQVVTYTLTNYGNIVKVFEPHLRNWKWERLPLLTQALLLMSYAHMQVEEVEKSVVISIAINLAKKYIEEKQAKFVHGILDEAL